MFPLQPLVNSVQLPYGELNGSKISYPCPRTGVEVCQFHVANKTLTLYGTSLHLINQNASFLSFHILHDISSVEIITEDSLGNA